MVAFHAQQAIEKSLKAIIDEFDLGFVKIHQIETLLEIVKEHVEADIDHEIVQILDSLYIESRYPVDIGLLPNGKPTEEDADKFFKFATLIYRTVKKKLEWKAKYHLSGYYHGHTTNHSTINLWTQKLLEPQNNEQEISNVEVKNRERQPQTQQTQWTLEPITIEPQKIEQGISNVEVKIREEPTLNGETPIPAPRTP